jgi:regulator of protease activity HflC (stomatin/prohibitin superfamily)
MWGSIAIITIIIIIIIVAMVVAVVVVVVIVVVVGTGNVQSVERFGYELEDERIAINFLRPISALAITEPPIRQVLARALVRGHTKENGNCNVTATSETSPISSRQQVSRLAGSH